MSESADDGKRYRIVRLYMRGSKRRVSGLDNLTLAQAQAHCHDPQTSSSTATSAAAKRRTASKGAWFDGYEEDN